MRSEKKVRVLGRAGTLAPNSPSSNSSEKVARRKVNDLDLVRQIKEPIWNRFTYRRPCDLGRSRAEALDVLHIQCGVHIDTRIE